MITPHPRMNLIQITEKCLDDFNYFLCLDNRGMDN